MLNQVLKVSSGTCQQSVKVLSKSVTFLDFRLSQGSVETYCRWCGNLYDVFIENFLTNHLVKEFWKLVHICQSYYQKSNSLLFWNTVYTILYRTVLIPQQQQQHSTWVLVCVAVSLGFTRSRVISSSLLRQLWSIHQNRGTSTSC